MQPIITYETHTVGELTRIVVEGFPILEGSTMMEKKEYLEKHYDHLRTALLCEPRGHKDMVEPLSPLPAILPLTSASFSWTPTAGSTCAATLPWAAPTQP